MNKAGRVSPTTHPSMEWGMRLVECVVKGQQSSEQAREFKGMRSRTVWHAQHGCFSIARHSCRQRAEKHWAPWTERGRHCLRGCERWKKGSGCLRKSLSSTKELITCISGGGKRSESKVNGVCAHDISCLKGIQVSPRDFSPYPAGERMSQSTSMDHTRLTTPGRNPKSLQQAAWSGMVWNEGHCSKQWAAASSSSTSMGRVFCFWTVFPLGAKAACCKCLVMWQHKRETTDTPRKVPLGKRNVWGTALLGLPLRSTPSDCQRAWLCQATMELVDNGGYASKYIFPVKAILLNLDSLILAILISVSSSWLQCSSPKALFPQKCWLMLSHQQADEQKRKHSREKLSKSHHPDMTAEAREPLSHTPPPTGRKTPSQSQKAKKDLWDSQNDGHLQVKFCDQAFCS